MHAKAAAAAAAAPTRTAAAATTRTAAAAAVPAPTRTAAAAPVAAPTRTATAAAAAAAAAAAFVYLGRSPEDVLSINDPNQPRLRQRMHRSSEVYRHRNNIMHACSRKQQSAEVRIHLRLQRQRP